MLFFFLINFSGTSVRRNPRHIWMGKCSLTASDALMNSMVQSVQFYVLVDPTCLFVLSVHVVFGHVISGQEVVQTMESQKTDPNSRPYAEVKVLNCGELVPKSKGLSAKHFFFVLFGTSCESFI